MKPEMLSMVDASADCQLADGAPKIHVLEPGKENWDVIRDVAHSGVQEEAFYVLDVGDIIRKHKEWKLKMPRVAPFYGKHLFENSVFFSSNLFNIMVFLGWKVSWTIKLGVFFF